MFKNRVSFRVGGLVKATIDMTNLTFPRKDGNRNSSTADLGVLMLWFTIKMIRTRSMQAFLLAR